MTALTVYWRPGCGYCRRLQKGLARAGVKYEAIDIWEDDAARSYVRSVADGNETVPTVRFGDEVMVNPPPADLLELIRDRAPELISGDPDRSILGFWRRDG